MKLLHYCPEGYTNKNGINYHTSWASKIMLVFKLGRFMAYFRWRSKNVGGKRLIFGYDIRQRWAFGELGFDFDTRSVSINGKPVMSYECLTEIVNCQDGEWVVLKKKDGYVQLAERQDFPEEP